MVAWSDATSFYQAHKTVIVVAGTVSGLFVLYKLHFSTPKKPDYPKDVVILHQAPPSNATPNSSQFCLKLETYLRIAKIPYQNVYGLKMSSKGKIPWIEYNGEAVADSNFCVRYLNKMFNIDLDCHLSEKDRAISRSFHVMLEENTYWSVTYYRFVDNFKQYSSEVFKDLLPPVRWFVSRLARKAAIGNLKSQGMGRHRADEVYTIGQNDIQALSVFLANNKYFMGENVSFVDAVVFAYVANMVWGDTDSPHTQYITNKCKNLIHYAERMRKEFYPDWDGLGCSN